MDVWTFAGIMLALLFGGLGIAYGGYTVHADYPLAAVSSYVFGGGCIAASIVLTFLRIAEHERRASLTLPVQAPTPTIQAVASPAVIEERVYVDLPPHELVAPFANQIAVQAKRSAARFLGKWYRVEGLVYNANQYSDEWIVTVFFDNPTRSFGPTQLSLGFDLRWIDRLELLERGSQIKAEGYIDKIDANIITLKKC